MLHQTLPILGQLWQLFEVSQILEFLRYFVLKFAISGKGVSSKYPEKCPKCIGVGRFRILGGPRLRILGGAKGAAKFPAGT